MPISRHSFAGANSDDEPGSAGAGSNTFTSGLNVFLEPGSVLPATGNVLVPYALPAGDNVRLGGFEDGATGTAVSLLYNSAGNHRLIRYDPQGNSGAGSETTLLEWAGLNLSPTRVPQGGIIDGLFIYLGADGYYRRINLARASVGEYTPQRLLDEPYALHLVPPPPAMAPSAAFTNATTDPQSALRIIQTKAYQFAVRWRYAEGEVSVLSPFSEWKDVEDDPATTAHTGIFLVLPAAPPSVREVEVLVREALTDTWAVADTLRPVGGVIATNYTFYGVVTGAVLTGAEATRPFEVEWPALVGGVANGRLLKANFPAEGYATPDPAFTVAVALNPTGNPDPRTLHESSTYRVVVQFYDAQGKAFGCSRPVIATVPARAASTTAQVLSVALTAFGAAQNAEIPEEAATYQFLVSRNDRTTNFRQGQAADTRGFLGYIRTVNTDGAVRETANLPDRSTPHEKLWVDIGNWPSVGMGYVWTPDSGDLLRFLSGGQVFLITGQYGDYVEVQWNGGPTDDRPLIEIYTPNTTAADVYYERGPRMRVLRDANGVRSYEQTTATLPGDCFLIGLKFPQLDFVNNYEPPDTKRYDGSTATVLVESMVPLYRLQAGSPVTVTNQVFFDPNVAVGTTQNVQTGRGANLWLDMSYGGRPGLAVPLALQRVARPTLLRFSGRKQQGNLLNGLSQWDALSQFDELPQEQGAVTRLSVADQVQSDGSILLVNQERGDTSANLGQARIQTADDQSLLATTKQVIGGANALRGGYGCTDAAAVVAYGGKVFYPCRRREEVLRYDRNGVVPLGEAYRFTNRLKSLFRQYVNAPLTACYNPRRKEYCLTFHAADDLPGATVVFCDRPNREAWADQLSAVPEAGLAVGNELVLYQAGAAWRHTPNAAVGTFFGQYTAPQLQFVVAAPTDVAKRWQTLEVVSQSLWLPAFLYTDTEQQSQMRPEWFVERDGVWRAPEGIRRDQNTAGFPGRPWQAIDEGLPLISPRLTITVICPLLAPAPLSSVGVSWLARPGAAMGV